MLPWIIVGGAVVVVYLIASGGSSYAGALSSSEWSTLQSASGTEEGRLLQRLLNDIQNALSVAAQQYAYGVYSIGSVDNMATLLDNNVFPYMPNPDDTFTALNVDGIIGPRTREAYGSIRTILDTVRRDVPSANMELSTIDSVGDAIDQLLSLFGFLQGDIGEGHAANVLYFMLGKATVEVMR